MNKELPNVFANKIDKVINNNEKVYYSNQRNDKKTQTTISIDRKDIVNNKNINQKIYDIFNSSRYIYKADVEITLKTGIVTKKVIGKNSQNLITYDNELIPISEIVDIKYKD